MNNDEAKMILGSYRAQGQDAGDTFFCEALLQAERDPSLGDWLRKEQARDAGIAELFATMPVPPAGRAQALAAMAASRGARDWWRPLALAASLALAALAGWQMWRHANEVRLPAAGPAEAALFLAENHPSIGHMGADAEDLRHWIQARGAPAPGGLPAGLAGLKVLGCETWRTNIGHASLLCFLSDSSERVHLYVFEDRGNWAGLPDASRPRHGSAGKWFFATWQAEGRVYVLASSAGGKEMAEWLRA